MNTDKRSSGDYQSDVEKAIVERHVYYRANEVVSKLAEYEPDEWHELFASQDWIEPVTYYINGLDMTYHSDRGDLLASMEYTNFSWEKTKQLKAIRSDFVKYLEDDEDEARIQDQLSN